LLSRRITVQPGGAEIVPVEERRAVTTASIRFPGTPAGRAMVSVEAFEACPVVLASRTITPADA
jgi:hypothetical protein